MGEKNHRKHLENCWRLPEAAPERRNADGSLQHPSSPDYGIPPGALVRRAYKATLREKASLRRGIDPGHAPWAWVPLAALLILVDEG